MAISANDVDVVSVKTADLDFPAGKDIPVTVEAEVGGALFATGGKYLVRLTMTDTTDPKLLDRQEIAGNYGDANWLASGLQNFTFTVPGAATAGRDGDLIQPQARVIGNAAAPFDTSSTVGGLILLTP
jgi:hypothetical protein